MYLVPRHRGCIDCGGALTRVAFTQLPLLLHAGYGEARHHEFDACTTVGCGRMREVAVSSLNPRIAMRGEPAG